MLVFYGAATSTDFTEPCFLGKSCWRHAFESHVRSTLIVVGLPSLDDAFSLLDRLEPVHIQTLVTTGRAALSRPLNVSIYALSVGLPGRLKSIWT